VEDSASVADPNCEDGREVIDICCGDSSAGHEFSDDEASSDVEEPSDEE